MLAEKAVFVVKFVDCSCGTCGCLLLYWVSGCGSAGVADASKYGVAAISIKGLVLASCSCQQICTELNRVVTIRMIATTLVTG